MAKVVVKAKTKKIKRKFLVEVQAPEYLNSVKLGKSEVVDLDGYVGKSLKINMMYVTGNVKHQNVRLNFKVVDVKSGLATTTVSLYEQIPYYLGRFVKKGSDLVEDSFFALSKDGIETRIKPFIVTKENIGANIASALRLRAREFLSKELSGQTYDEFMSSVINGKAQNLLRTDLRKIFPLKSVEFKKVGSN